MDNENSKIIGDIQEILQELDTESLIFLKEQASVLLYNREVRERNAQQQETHKAENKTEKTNNKNTNPDIYIEPLKNGKYFNICIDEATLFMDKKEIKDIFQIAKGAQTPASGAAGLYNWFKRERKDVLVDGHISHAEHPRLILIYRALLDTFTL